MIEKERLHDLVENPEDVIYYLLGSGWTLVGATDNETLWRNDAAGPEWQLIAPIGSVSPSSIRSMDEAVAVLASLHNRRPEQIASDVGTSRRDLIRLRTFPRSASGSAPLGDAITLSKALHELLLSAAATADDARPVLGNRKTAQVVEYANSAAVSTERGSFVLALAIEIEPSVGIPAIIDTLSTNDGLFPDPVRPFARRATERLIEASDAAATAAASPNSHDTQFTGSIERGVSANFLEALAALGGVPDEDEIDVKAGVFRPFDLGVRWSYARPSDVPSRTVHFGAELAPVFASGARALRIRNPERNTTISGRVTALRDGDDGGGQIVINSEIVEESETRIRPVRIDLSRERYQQALIAKATGRRLAIVGDLQRTRRLALTRLRSFQVLEPPKQIDGPSS